MAGTRILVIDDDRSFIRHMQTALRGLGEVRATTCGVDGLRTVDYWEPDVVMLDLLLYDVDGFTLLERLTGPDRRHRPAVLCLTDGLGAGTRHIRGPYWPVGTVERTAPAHQLRRVVLHAASTCGRQLSAATA